jgi:hypothetical protein
LPFNLRTPGWGKAIAKQIDKDATQTAFDPVGGFLRARVTVDVTKPLRRGILIESAARKGTDWYEFQYEHLPHFCFSCGRLGHSDLLCPTPGPRDANGNLPYGAGLRALDERKKTNSNENSSREQPSGQNGKWETRFSSNAREAGVEVSSPVKRNDGRKRKVDKVAKVYQKVVPPLPSNGAENNQMVIFNQEPPGVGEGDQAEKESGENDSNKKRKTPPPSVNSAEAAMQPCPSQ